MSGSLFLSQGAWVSRQIAIAFHGRVHLQRAERRPTVGPHLHQLKHAGGRSSLNFRALCPLPPASSLYWLPGANRDAAPNAC